MVDSGPHFLIARLLVVGLALISVYLVYRLGKEAYGAWTGVLAALFLAVEPLHAKYSHMAVTDVPAVTLSLLALLALLRAAQGRSALPAVGRARGRPGDVHEVQPRHAAAAGAVAALYAAQPGIRRLGLRGRRAARARLSVLARRVVAPMLVAFVAGSPFVLIDLPASSTTSCGRGASCSADGSASSRWATPTGTTSASILPGHSGWCCSAWRWAAWRSRSGGIRAST